MSHAATIFLQHAELGTCHEVPVHDLDRASPSLLLAYLQEQGAIPPERAERPYMVLADGRRLVPNESFARQGLGDRAVLTVLTRGLGATEDAPVGLATAERRALDFEVIRSSFRGGQRGVRRFRAFASRAAAELEEPTEVPEQASVYIFDLAVRTPISEDVYGDLWTVRLDASSARYPYAEPEAFVLEETRPWNPHVRPPDGFVCAGSLWHPSKLLAFYVVDLLRVLNFDFGVDMGDQGGHYQPASVEWWRARYGGAPLQRDLYPEVRVPRVAPAAPCFGAVQRGGT